jgi:hypothetical protein
VRRAKVPHGRVNQYGSLPRRDAAVSLHYLYGILIANRSVQPVTYDPAQVQ